MSANTSRIMSDSLLEVQDLSVSYHSHRGTVQAVRNVSFSLGREKLGIVGESGSGKSQTGRAILGLNDANAEIKASKLSFDGIDLLNADNATLRAVRGNRISMIMQDPKYSLNPVMNIGKQIMEAYRVHHKSSRREARERSLAMLEAVQIRNPERVMRAYPHEMSGGMGQRVMIAMMMIPEPDIIIADEPTSALDVTVQQQVLELLDELIISRGLGLIFISHDLNLVSRFCDRVLVMYAGQVVETIAANVLHEAQHPYTRGLLNCMPRIDAPTAELPTLRRQDTWAIDQAKVGATHVGS